MVPVPPPAPNPGSGPRCSGLPPPFDRDEPPGLRERPPECRPAWPRVFAVEEPVLRPQLPGPTLRLLPCASGVGRSPRSLCRLASQPRLRPALTSPRQRLPRETSRPSSAELIKKLAAPPQAGVVPHKATPRTWSHFGVGRHGSFRAWIFGQAGSRRRTPKPAGGSQGTKFRPETTQPAVSRADDWRTGRT